jgi:hypothetical protein
MISKGILRLTLFSLSLAGITMQLHAQAPATTFEELRDWASALWQAPVLRRSRSAQHAKTMASVQRSLRFSSFRRSPQQAPVSERCSIRSLTSMRRYMPTPPRRRVVFFESLQSLVKRQQV